MDERLKEVLQRNDIDPATVIDAQMEMRAEHMWRTKAAWPAGGMYEGQPRNFDDVMVAQRVTTRATVDVVGRHPEGKLLMVESGGLERSQVEVVDVGPWVFEK